MQNKKTWWIDILFLTVVLGGVFFLFLGSRPLLVPEEGRYAEIIREMFLSQDYVTPHLDGVNYFEKPILFYWLGVLAVKIGGIHLWVLRSVNAVFAILGCLLTYTAARLYYDRLTGLFAGFVLGASGLYFFLLHVINLDISATFFLSLSLFSFLLATQKVNWQRRLLVWISFSAAALCVLTKGLMGIVLPGLIVGLWMLFTNQWRLLKSLYLPSAMVIFLLIAVPWHVLVSMRHPEFFHFYFIEQQFVRFATTQIGHYQPVWFFVPVLLMGFFPWIVFLPAALRQKKANGQVNLFLLIWIVSIFVFFSLSKSKLISYVLPIFPPLAIVTGHYFASLNKKACRQLMLLWVLMIVFWQIMIPIILKANTQSIYALLPVIESRLNNQDEVVTYKQYYYDLPFYLGRKVSVVDWRGELAFGNERQHVEWLYDEKTFWKKWRSGQRVFVFTDNDEFATLMNQDHGRKICVLGRTKGVVLFTQC